MSCHVTSCHVLSCHVMSCHVMSSHVFLRLVITLVMSCHVVSRFLTSCHNMSSHVLSRLVISCHVMSRLVMSCHVMSCHVISRLLTSCHIMSCHVMSRHATPESCSRIFRPSLLNSSTTRFSKPWPCAGIRLGATLSLALRACRVAGVGNGATWPRFAWQAAGVGRVGGVSRACRGCVAALCRGDWVELRLAYQCIGSSSCARHWQKVRLSWLLGHARGALCGTAWKIHLLRLLELFVRPVSPACDQPVGVGRLAALCDLANLARSSTERYRVQLGHAS